MKKFIQFVVDNPRWFGVIFGLLLLCSIPGGVQAFAPPKQEAGEFILIGRTLDPQGEPVVEAEVVARLAGQSDASETTIAHGETQDDGYWFLAFVELPDDVIAVKINHPHFKSQEILLDAGQRAQLFDPAVPLNLHLASTDDDLFHARLGGDLFQHAQPGARPGQDAGGLDYLGIVRDKMRSGQGAGQVILEPLPFRLTCPPAGDDDPLFDDHPLDLGKQ